jgi:hypothetical protein
VRGPAESIQEIVRSSRQAADVLSIQKLCAVAGVGVGLVIAGCGSSGGSSSSSSNTTSTRSATTGSAAGASASVSATAGAPAAGALSAEARATATGDIPDNQVFLVFTNRRAGYSIKYPEGWTQSGSVDNVTFRDKNNLVHVVIDRGATPSPASVAAQLTALKGSNPTLSFHPPKIVQLGSTRVIKATYTTQSAPNPVTGKRVTLIVDRYELASGGRRAVVDLGTAVGVDNVDAYRKMIESFQWG